MNIRSELRIAWFVDSYLKNAKRGLRILGTGTGKKGYIEKQAATGRFAFTRLEKLQNQPQGPVTPIYWNMVAENSYDVVIGGHSSANEKILELIVYEMARAVKPGGHICLVISQALDPSGQGDAPPMDAPMLASLAYRNHLTALHASCNLAPLGADPAWYDDGYTDMLLVAEKPLTWEDIPPDESMMFSCTEDIAAICEEFVPKAMQPLATVAALPKKSIPTGPAGRINYLARSYDATSYLEISHHPGKTFSLVKAPVKVLACPTARQEDMAGQGGNTVVLPLASDAFFKQLESAASPLREQLKKTQPSLLFDIIFINGEHTFAHSLRDFTNSLAYAHKNTIFVLNASVPCDPYSAIPDRKEALAYRRAAGLEGKAWHGDVFKTVFAIHDLFPQYSYCTLTEKTTQTIIWYAEREKRAPLFSSLERIDALDYFGMVRHAAALMPVESSMLPKLIGKALDPCRYARQNSWKKLFYAPAAVAENTL